jgi:hypothetical protein
VSIRQVTPGGAGGIIAAGDAHHQMLTVVIGGYAIIETKILAGHNPVLRRPQGYVFSGQPMVQA